MTYLILSVLLWLWDNRSFDKITQNNIARMQALQAYEAGDYRRATERYQALVTSSLFTAPSARLNLAHSYFQLGQWEQARNYYQQVAHVANPALSTTAHVQLGVIATVQGDSAAALAYFRKALEIEPGNKLAQFDYEFIKKTYSGKPNPTASQRPNPTARQQPSDAQADRQKPQQGGMEVEQNDKKDELLRRLRSLNLSEDQVLTILNSMQDNEVQYMHQRKQSPTRSAGQNYKRW